MAYSRARRAKQRRMIPLFGNVKMTEFFVKAYIHAHPYFCSRVDFPKRRMRAEAWHMAGEDGFLSRRSRKRRSNWLLAYWAAAEKEHEDEMEESYASEMAKSYEKEMARQCEPSYYYDLV